MIVSSVERRVGSRKKAIASACEQKTRTSAGAALRLSLPTTYAVVSHRMRR